jgi:SsrA-binding protein
MDKTKIKIITKNKKAYHDYFIIEKYEAGIELKGTEIKSIREGRCNLKDSYARITKDKEIFLYNFHISPYKNQGYVTHDPLRPKSYYCIKAKLISYGKRLLYQVLHLFHYRFISKVNMLKSS